jgi:hypothetical protein
MIEAPHRVKLLVLHTNFHHQQGRQLYARLERKCSRTPFRIKHKEELFVRYNNMAYLLYSPESTNRLIEKARIIAKQSMIARERMPDGDISLALLTNDYSNYFHCVLERPTGHFHSF